MKLRLTETKDMAVYGKAEQRLSDFAEDMEGVENEVVNL